MVRTLSKYVLPALCLFALAMYAPQAKAGTIDFQCQASGCTGDISGGVGSGVTAVELGGTAVWNVSFNAGAGTISLMNGGTTFSGVFAPTSGSSCGTNFVCYDVTVTWDGSSSMAPTHFAIATDMEGAVQSEDIAVTTTPEPASLLLLGTGLLGMGAVVRRRLIG